MYIFCTGVFVKYNFIEHLIIYLFQEMECLQDNFDELSERCQWAVGNFTEDEDSDPNMDKLLMKYCSPMIKKFCDVSKFSFF